MIPGLKTRLERELRIDRPLGIFSLISDET